MSLARASTAALVHELTRRNALPRCGCGKWGTYMGRYDEEGYTLRCSGCKRSIRRCTC